MDQPSAPDAVLYRCQAESQGVDFLGEIAHGAPQHQVLRSEEGGDLRQVEVLIASGSALGDAIEGAPDGRGLASAREVFLNGVRDGHRFGRLFHIRTW